MIGVDTDMIARYGPLLLAGLVTTLRVCALASVIALLAGLGLALLLRARLLVVRAAARTYVEVMRGTPILVILFLLYYGGPSFGLVLDAEPVGIFGLGFYGAAYFAEIFRAGFESIPKGQLEAARMVGLAPRQIVYRIQIPQMLGLIVPPSVNQVIILVKEFGGAFHHHRRRADQERDPDGQRDLRRGRALPRGGRTLLGADRGDRALRALDRAPGAPCLTTRAG